jgi:hypothetical protein
VLKLRCVCEGGRGTRSVAHQSRVNGSRFIAHQGSGIGAINPGQERQERGRALVHLINIGAVGRVISGGIGRRQEGRELALSSRLYRPGEVMGGAG